MIQTQRYIRKPLYVDAVRVTAANFEDIAEWCQGEISRDEPSETHKKGRRFIRVRVHNPVTPKQSKAYIGDWVLYTDKGYKIYNNRAFASAFDPAPETDVPVSDERLTGDPVVDANAETLSKEEHPGSFGPPPVNGDVEFVRTTPHAIAEAIFEDDDKRADLDIPPSNGTVESVPEQEKVVPSAVEGKRVLSVEEQSGLTPDEIRDLVQSGEAVLAQDVAQPQGQ